MTFYFKIHFHFIDVPAAPAAPQVTGKSLNSLSLSWKAPSSDGGTPLIGYYIERSTNQSDRWFRITRDTLTRPQLDQNDLIEGTVYQYRVVATNKKGDSKPSEPSEPFTCESKFGK